MHDSINYYAQIIFVHTSLEWQQLVKQDVSGIRAVVHQVQFSDDGDGSVA